MYKEFKPVLTNGLRTGDASVNKDGLQRINVE
jgi:hypothetical protein